MRCPRRLLLSLSLTLAACERGASPSSQPDAEQGEPAAGDPGDSTASDARASDAGEPEPSEPEPQPQRQLSSVEVSALHWANPTDDGRSRIDVIDLPDPDALYALSDAHGNPDGTSSAFPASVTLPGGHAIGDEWVVATSEGERRAKAVAFGGYGGASEFHFIVVLDAPLQGLAARASAWTGSAPRVREVEPQSMDQGETTAMFERIMPALVASADKGATRALQRKPLAAAHATAVAGNFPGGFTHIVSVVRLLRPDDSTADRVSGLFLADASGRTFVISPLTLTMTEDEIEYLVDVEGDGIDEVLFTNSYYEGSYLVFMSWDAEGKPQLRTLEGDGA